MGVLLIYNYQFSYIKLIYVFNFPSFFFLPKNSIQSNKLYTKRKIYLIIWTFFWKALNFNNIMKKKKFLFIQQKNSICYAVILVHWKFSFIGLSFFLLRHSHHFSLCSMFVLMQYLSYQFINSMVIRWIFFSCDWIDVICEIYITRSNLPKILTTFISAVPSKFKKRNYFYTW